MSSRSHPRRCPARAFILLGVDAARGVRCDLPREHDGQHEGWAMVRGFTGLAEERDGAGFDHPGRIRWKDRPDPARAL